MFVSKSLPPSSAFETYAEYVAAYRAIGQKQFVPEEVYNKLRKSPICVVHSVGYEEFENAWRTV